MVSPSCLFSAHDAHLYLRNVALQREQKAFVHRSREQAQLFAYNTRVDERDNRSATSLCFRKLARRLFPKEGCSMKYRIHRYTDLCFLSGPSSSFPASTHFSPMFHPTRETLYSATETDRSRPCEGKVQQTRQGTR